MIENYSPYMIKVYSTTGKFPEYQTAESSGMDLQCSEEVTLNPGERKVIGTGVYLSIPPGLEGQVRPRSGLAAKKGLSMVNTPGTIDSDYRGEVKLILLNTDQKDSIHFNAGDRVAQLVIVPVIRASIIPVNSIEDLDSTDRGDGGFGSTGTK